ncbi:uncharacterized protein ACJ7VT_002074 [Polymixia lowei]
MTHTRGGTVNARATWSNKPWINVNTSDIVEGEWVRVQCGVPIDYTGGDCRLYRGSMKTPLKIRKADLSYVCRFLLSSQELLGRRAVGTRTTVRCDYKFQGYTSESSDNAVVVVWGSSEAPRLALSLHVVSLNETVEVSCSPPRPISRCALYRDGSHIRDMPCRHNLTGAQLSVWLSAALVQPVSLSCRYQTHNYIRSEPSNEAVLFIIDLTRADVSSSAVECQVPVTEQMLVMLENTTVSSGVSNGRTVNIQATNSSILLHPTCTNE